MALPELTQAQALLTKATAILLLVPEKPSADAFASMVALYLALHSTKKNQTVDEISPSHVPKNLHFLPGSSQVRTQPQRQPDVVVDIAGPTTIVAIRHEQLHGGLRVHLTLPENTSLTKDNIETLIRPLPYDIAVVIGATDLEGLGAVFTAHADFFYNTPLINIDHRPDNEHYGTVNIVDITASSTAEVMYELITHTKAVIDPSIATALYAGMIAGTESFQKPSTTPKAFKIAAGLMEHKADKEAVIQNLVKTKPLALLKLVGRIYARLRYDEHTRLFWSVIRTIDFQESGASSEDLPDAMRELANNITDFTVAYILSERVKQYDIWIVLGKGLLKRRGEIQSLLSASRRNGLLTLTISASSLPEAEKQALERIRTVLP